MYGRWKGGGEGVRKIRTCPQLLVFFYPYNIPIIEVIDIVEIAEKEIELVQNDERHLRHKQKIFFSQLFLFCFWIYSHLSNPNAFYFLSTKCIN